MLGQTFSIASAENYSDGPKYYRGNALTLGMMVAGLAITAVSIWFLAQKNAAKVRARGSEDAAAARHLGIEEIEDNHPDFTYYL